LTGQQENDHNGAMKPKWAENMATIDLTRELVRKVLLDNPGIAPREIAANLDIGLTTARRHIKAIRAEWLNKDAGQ